MVASDAETNDDVATIVIPLNKEDLANKKDDSKLTSFFDAVINKTPDDVNNILIQPVKSIPLEQVGDYSTRNSDKKEPNEEILSTQKTAKKRNITHSGSDRERSEDESIVKHCSIKKQKRNSTDDDSSIRLEN